MRSECYERVYPMGANCSPENPESEPNTPHSVTNKKLSLWVTHWELHCTLTWNEDDEEEGNMLWRNFGAGVGKVDSSFYDVLYAF